MSKAKLGVSPMANRLCRSRPARKSKGTPSSGKHDKEKTATTSRRSGKSSRRSSEFRERRYLAQAARTLRPCRIAANEKMCIWDSGGITYLRPCIKRQGTLAIRQFPSRGAPPSNQHSPQSPTEELVSWHHKTAPRIRHASDGQLPQTCKTDLAALRSQVRIPCAAGCAPMVRQVETHCVSLRVTSQLSKHTNT